MNNISAYIWNFINKFGSQFLWLITTIILARFLSPDEFGVIGVLSIVFMVANTLTESGLGGALVIQRDLQKVDCSTISVFNIVVSLLIYSVIFFFSNEIEAFYKVDGLARVTRFLSLVFVINAWGIVPRTIMYRDLKFKAMCIISLIAVTISSFVAIILAYFNYGVYALVSYQLVLALINTIGLFIWSHYRFDFHFSKTSFRKLFSFGFYTTITGILDTVYENILATLFGKFLSIAQAGLFSQAKKIEEASSQSLLSTVNNTAFPILAKKKEDLESFKKEADTIIKVVPLLIFPMLMTIGVFSKEIVLVLFGEKWLLASGYLSLLVIAGMCMIYDAINRNFIKSLGKVENLFVYTIAKRVLGCSIIILFAFVSVRMVLYGYIISAFLGFLLNCHLYSKLIGENLFLNIQKSLKSLIVLIPLYLCLYLGYIVIPNTFIKIIISLALLSFFYIVVLPQYGINILSRIKLLLNK